MTKEAEMGHERARLEEIMGAREIRGYGGVGRTIDGAIHDAWAKVPQAEKPNGLRLEIVVGGGNPIRWYGAILETT